MVESEQLKVMTQQEDVIESVETLVQDSSSEMVIEVPPSVHSTTSMTTKISFGFTRQTKQTVVATNQSFSSRVDNANEPYEDEDEGQHARKRGVLSLEDGVIIDSEPTKKKEKKSYVIQVKKASNDWRIERLKKIIEEGTATDEDKARFALLLEAINPDGAKDEVSVPIPSHGNVTVLSSKVDDMVDPDYNEIPVGEFGLAFLRGCGWKETAGIGKSNQKAVPLRISEPRPKGLGLGASISVPPSGKDKEKKGSDKSHQNGNGNSSVKKELGEDDVKPLGKRSYVKCLGGLNKDAIGEVISMDEENASVFVELSWPPKSCGKTVRMNQFAVQVISPAEFKEKLKDSRATADPTIQTNDREKSREDRKSKDQGEKDKKRRRSRDRDGRRGGAERIRAPS